MPVVGLGQIFQLFPTRLNRSAAVTLYSTNRDRSEEDIYASGRHQWPFCKFLHGRDEMSVSIVECGHNEAIRTLSVRNCQENKFQFVLGVFWR